jgi:hypothetical protein
LVEREVTVSVEQFEQRWGEERVGEKRVLGEEGELRSC